MRKDDYRGRRNYLGYVLSEKLRDGTLSENNESYTVRGIQRNQEKYVFKSIHGFSGRRTSVTLAIALVMEFWIQKPDCTGIKCEWTISHLTGEQ